MPKFQKHDSTQFGADNLRNRKQPDIRLKSIDRKAGKTSMNLYPGYKARHLATVAAIAWGGVAAAQGTSTVPVPLLDAARKAVATNPEVQARWNGFLAADDERDVARGGLKPSVDFTANVGREYSSTPIRNSGTYNFNASRLSLTQMLFDGGFISSEVRRLGYAKLTRYYELAEASETAALEAMRAYADVARYRELVDAAKQNYTEHRQTVVLVEERANSGVGRRVDVEQANGRLALAESNLLTELTNLHDVSARYLRIVGEKPPANLPGLPENFMIGPMPVSNRALMNDGLQGSPTLNAAVENVRAYTQAIETRKSAYQPRISVNAYQSFDRNSSGIQGDSRGTGVEVVLNFNLYKGGADQASERQAVKLKYQALDLQEKACRDVRQTLSIAYSDMRNLVDQQRYQDLRRLATEKSLEAYRQQFQIGQRTLLDLLDSQNEFFEASRAYINARHNQIVAQGRVLAGMGRLVTALGVSRPDVPMAQAAGQDRNGIDPSQICPADHVDLDSIEKIKAEFVMPPRAPVPAPVSPPPPAPRAVTKISLPGDLLFDFDQAELKPPGITRLEELVRSLKDVALDVVIATGHTDSTGSDAYNDRLSLARANTVKEFLVSRGLDVKRVRAVGKGSSRPIADNDTAEGRSRNRRVEVEVVPLSAPAR